MKLPRSIWPFAFLAACLIASPKLVEAANSYYNASGTPAQGSALSSAAMRTEFSSIASGFDKMPALTAGTAVVVNGPGTALTNTVGTLALGGNFATTGAFSTTFVQQADALFTLPAATDALVGRASPDTFTNKTFDTAGTGNVFKINGVTISDVTGSGSVVLASNPVLVAPNLGTPSAINLTNGTGLPISTGVSGLGTGIATFLAMPSSANLRGALTDETGTGAAVFATSPTLVTPALGVATATSIAINGATLGSNALAVAGNTALFGDTQTGHILLNGAGGGSVTITGFALTRTDSVGNIFTNFGNPFQISNHSNGDFSVGVQLVDGGNSWASYSDETLKTPFVPFTNALFKVAQIKSGTARYLTDPEGVSRAFMSAQSVQRVLPEAVHSYNGKLLLSQTDVIALMVAAFQDQVEINHKLEARVAALEAH